jgi:integrase
MARRPSVRWSESAQRWMAWVRFPDGSRRKVERVDRSDAEADLDKLLELRAKAETPARRPQRLLTFNEVIDAWMSAGCPTPAPTKGRRHARTKCENTLHKARSLLDCHVRPMIGTLRVERTPVEGVEDLFQKMDEAGYATSTIHETWSYLNDACLYAVRNKKIEQNPAEQAVLPAARPVKVRKSFTVEQAKQMLLEGIPQDPRPALWLTGLMCGLRPGELAGLRWIYLDIDSDQPSLEVAERSNEVNKKYVGQAEPKTARKGRIGLHPLVVAALRRHRDDMRLLGLYDPDDLGGPFDPVGFVFCTRNGTPMSLSNLRRAFQRLCKRAGLVEDQWTTYELRHSGLSLVADQIEDLTKVADLAGHADTRTTQGYRHAVRPSLPHAIEAWDRLLGRDGQTSADAA